MDKITFYIEEINKIYNDALNDCGNVLERIDNFLIDLPIFDDKSLFEIYDDNELKEFFKNISVKIATIYSLIDLKVENVSIEDLRKEFLSLEKLRFETVNKYIMGIINRQDIEVFKDSLFGFRHRLYAISISDNNILEIAKMKSKAQHFYTEVLEDEDILKVAYNNSN